MKLTEEKINYICQYPLYFTQEIIYKKYKFWIFNFKRRVKRDCIKCENCGKTFTVGSALYCPVCTEKEERRISDKVNVAWSDFITTFCPEESKEFIKKLDSIFLGESFLIS